MTGFTDAQKKILDAPLDRDRVSERKGEGGGKFSYLETWDVIDRANRIFGYDGWCHETTLLKETWNGTRRFGREQKEKSGCSYIAKVRVIVFAGERQIIREGVGYGDGDGYDLGKATELAVKEAESDALKRALKSFGNQFGLALYDKEQTNVRRGADDEIEEIEREAERPAETRSDFPGDRPFPETGSIREKVERKVEEKRRAPETASDARVFAWSEPEGNATQREAYWRTWARQFAPAIRAAASHDAALTIIEFNRDGLKAYGAELECDAIQMVRDIADRHFGYGAPEPEAERTPDAATDPNHVPAPTEDKYDDWDAWMDVLYGRIKDAGNRADAIAILDANGPALTKVKEFIDMDGRDYFMGKITTLYGGEKARKSRADGKTARGR